MHVAVPPGAEAASTLTTLSRLARGPSAAVLLSAVPARLGIGIEAAADLVVELLEAGHLEAWPDCPNGPAVVVSASAAAKLGLTLEPSGPYGIDSRYVPIRQRRRREKKRPKDRRVQLATDVDTGDGAGLQMDRLADTRAVPPEWAAAVSLALEEPRIRMRAARLATASGTVPKASRLLGVRLIWQGPAHVETTVPCPACFGRPLTISEYCLCCCRSGAEHWLPSVPIAHQPKAYKPDKPASRELSFGRKKAHRKAIKKARGNVR